MVDYGWNVSTDFEPPNVHVLPENDIYEHEPKGCLCGPEHQRVTEEDGTVSVVVVHMSLDGREVSSRKE